MIDKSILKIKIKDKLNNLIIRNLKLLKPNMFVQHLLFISMEKNSNYNLIISKINGFYKIIQFYLKNTINSYKINKQK
jgi:hypothetical protein